MRIQSAIEQKLQNEFQPAHWELENESHKHSSGLGSESHFRALIVSDRFAGMNRIGRQRRVFEVLADEMRQIHALSLRLLTPQEWQEGQGDNFQSPNCQSKKSL